MTQKCSVRAITRGDFESWLPLWRGYLRFYRQRLDDNVTHTTFERLVDPHRQPHGLVAQVGDTIVGFATYLFHPSSWCLTEVCYLEDLFVEPATRGTGAGRALIQAVYDAADAAGVSGVYWMTQEYNTEARALYDTLAHRTSFIRYQR